MSQDQTLFVFTIGPVQAFIAASRKLEDLWSGSYLLTLLAKHAIDVLNQHVSTEQIQMIFPSNPVMEEQWIGKHPVAYLPNRFLCVLHAPVQQVVGWANQVEVAVRRKIQEMVNFAIQDVFVGATAQSLDKPAHPFLQNLALQQVMTQIEVSWSVEPITNGLLEEARKEIEKKHNASKRRRVLPTLEQSGIVCTVCGQQDALHLNPYEDCAQMRDLRRELQLTWNRRVKKYKDRILDREYLCGVCLIKRTGRDFASKVLGQEIPPYRSIDEIGKGDGYYGILLMDGDNMGQWLAGHDNLRPASNREQDVIAHLHTISDRLAAFSRQTVPEIVNRHGGKLLYAGGDDVLAMAPVDRIFLLAQELRSSFASVDKGLHTAATSSAGIVLADLKAPLQKLLHQVRRLEHRSKSYQKGRKDAVAVAVYPRSGEVREFVLPWSISARGECDSSLLPLTTLDTLMNLLGTELSSTFLFAFKEAFLPLFGGGVVLERATTSVVNPLSHDALTTEMHRLLTRASLRKHPPHHWYPLASELLALQGALGSMLEFVHCLEATRFVNQIVKGRKEVTEAHDNTPLSNSC